MKYFVVTYALLIISKAGSFGQVAGSNVFNDSGMHDIHITFTQQNFSDSLDI